MEKKMDRAAVKKVKSFDKKLKELDDYRILMLNIGKYMFLFFGFLIMMFPVSDKEFEFIFAVLSFYFLEMAVYLQLQPYLQIKDKEKQVFIYEKLRYLPVKRQDLIRVREEYLFHFCNKIGVIILLSQMLGALLSRNVNVFNLLYPIAMWLLLLSTGYLSVRMYFRKR